ncbi:RluA family pseudouridine synthase [Candidatus Wolfebacteria bacterium]|nr:MAG: RluA family pseudouridine synthase [Candidatus Wolfebacteria bacterium]
MNIDILYEDNDIVAIYKPVGLMVHSDGRTKDATLVDWILERYSEMKEVGEPMTIIDSKTKEEVELPRPGIVHRLDKDTSGVLLIAKNQKSFFHLKDQFQNRTVQKTYRTIVWGSIKNDEGEIDKPIARSKSDFRLWSAQRGARGLAREAITLYEVLDRFKVNVDTFTYIEVKPKTGRTHQIRVHMKYLNHPVVCDSLYAPKRTCPILGMSRLALHAYSIEFILLNGEKITVEAPLPDDFNKFLAKVK